MCPWTPSQAALSSFKKLSWKLNEEVFFVQVSLQNLRETFLPQHCILKDFASQGRPSYQRTPVAFNSPCITILLCCLPQLSTQPHNTWINMISLQRLSLKREHDSFKPWKKIFHFLSNTPGGVHMRNSTLHHFLPGLISRGSHTCPSTLQSNTTESCI